MKKFVFMYYGSDISKDASQEEMKASRDNWMGWFGTFQNKIVDSGNPFALESKSVSSKGVETVSSHTTPSTGYTIVNAEDMDEAVEIAKGCPLAKSADGAVQVYESMPM